MRTSYQCLCDLLLIIILVFKLSVLPIAHHEQVALELLLLGRVKFAFFVVTVIFFLFSILSSVAIFALVIIVAKTCLVSLISLLLRHCLSITKMSLRELLVCTREHLLFHELLAGHALPIELSRIKLHYRCSISATTARRYGTGLPRVVLWLVRLIRVDVGGTGSSSGIARGSFVSWASFCGYLALHKQWVGLRRGQLGVHNVRIRRAVLATTQLSTIHLIVLLLKLAHFLDLVQVDNEAGLKIVEIFDALAAENRRMLAAVKVLYALLVLLAHVGGEVSLVSLVVLVHIRVRLQALLEVNTGE